MASPRTATVTTSCFTCHITTPTVILILAVEIDDWGLFSWCEFRHDGKSIILYLIKYTQSLLPYWICIRLHNSCSCSLVWLLLKKLQFEFPKIYFYLNWLFWTGNLLTKSSTFSLAKQYYFREYIQYLFERNTIQKWFVAWKPPIQFEERNKYDN